MEIVILVEGEPVPAQRPRFSGRRCYQPARNVEYRSEVEYAARLAMRGKQPLKGALSANVKLYRKYKPTSRIFGDVDNHLKALFDGMNQIVFEDDAQIVQCSVSKHTDKKNPRAEIWIREL
ncbi:MAG: RusA family crossover junction endodeoxyribonuclease [Selenomonadaceae bacterium]|nr:RusA family crossover junction endodeoxyribonuclease [Selenomonadaceae bacterium]